MANAKYPGGKLMMPVAGDDADAKKSVMSLAAEYGAAVICLLIDERGQARDVEWKMAVAHRIHDLATTRYGLRATSRNSSAATAPRHHGVAAVKSRALTESTPTNTIATGDGGSAAGENTKT